MLQRFRIHARLFAVLVAACIGWSASVHAAPADDLKEAQKLYNQGKLQPALDKVDAFLRTQPKDAQGRFLKGLILTEEKRTAEAIQVFTGLTEDYPELPEPYNNLAVLYASQGEYEKAKSALELAIHTHPTYATAHENLGDIYAQLASRAYDRALQLDKNNTSAQVKLAMVKDLFSAQKIAAASTHTPVAKAAAPKEEPAKIEPPRNAAPKAEAPRASTTLAEAPKVAAASVQAAPAASAPQPKAAATDANAQIAASLESWARAWSAKDVKAYLAHYAPDFQVPHGESRAAWEKQRRERIHHPKSIAVGIKILSTSVKGDEATVRVRQSYHSDTLKTSSTKTFKLVKSGDRWLIKQEHVGG